jgi:hypothetical protein
MLMSLAVIVVVWYLPDRSLSELFMNKGSSSSLPTPRELKARAREAKARLKQLFACPKLKLLSGYSAVGLCRIEEKLAMALLLTEHMEQQEITSVPELASRLYIGDEYLPALEWMRSPAAFHLNRSKKCTDNYLLALCGIDWNPHTKSFFFSESSAT